MIGRLLCWLLGHRWKHVDETTPMPRTQEARAWRAKPISWEPQIRAVCSRCGLNELL